MSDPIESAITSEHSRQERAWNEALSNDAIPMILTCPSCGARHIDKGEFATKVHHTHACQHCGMVWRPALVPTVGVQFLPGFKNQQPSGTSTENGDG
jgi:predicted RNA-binding Zn-ribbon protein involved in translation (DUF1610 family)